MGSWDKDGHWNDDGHWAVGLTPVDTGQLAPTLLDSWAVGPYVPELRSELKRPYRPQDPRHGSRRMTRDRYFLPVPYGDRYIVLIFSGLATMFKSEVPELHQHAPISVHFQMMHIAVAKLQVCFSNRICCCYWEWVSRKRAGKSRNQYVASIP